MTSLYITAAVRGSNRPAEVSLPGSMIELLAPNCSCSACIGNVMLMFDV